MFLGYLFKHGSICLKQEYLNPYCSIFPWEGRISSVDNTGSVLLEPQITLPHKRGKRHIFLEIVIPHDFANEKFRKRKSLPPSKWVNKPKENKMSEAKMHRRFKISPINPNAIPGLWLDLLACPPNYPYNPQPCHMPKADEIFLPFYCRFLSPGIEKVQYKCLSNLSNLTLPPSPHRHPPPHLYPDIPHWHANSRLAMLMHDIFLVCNTFPICPPGEFSPSKPCWDSTFMEIFLTYNTLPWHTYFCIHITVVVSASFISPGITPEDTWSFSGLFLDTSMASFFKHLCLLTRGLSLRAFFDHRSTSSPHIVGKNARKLMP